VALSDRIPYQAQIDRPKLTLPDGKKLAVRVILNVEEWRIENAMPRTVLRTRPAISESRWVGFCNRRDSLGSRETISFWCD